MNFWFWVGGVLLASVVIYFALSINGKNEPAGGHDAHGHGGHDDHGGHGHH